MAQNGGLTKKQVKALPALLTCRTVEEAAKAAGIGERTLQRWLSENEAFRAAYQGLIADAVNEAARLMTREIAPSIRTLTVIRDNPKARNADRIKAAATLLDRHGKMRDLSHFEEALARVEKALHATKQTH